MIDPSLIKHLPDAAQVELRNWENLFAGKGWSQLKNLVEQNFEAAKNSALSASTWEENRLAVGHMNAMKFVFNIADVVEQQYTSLAEQVISDEEEKAEDDSLEYE
jgi:hypothetical protein